VFWTDVSDQPSAPSWEGSDVVAAALAGLGCRYLALNPGASLRGLHDSLVNPLGPAPDLLLCLHEEIAVAVAHGYAKAARRPMAVGVHDTVGLLHASMAIFNAWVDRAPMLVLAGTGPLDASQRRPWIDWIHTVADQTAAVRDWTVWTDQPIGDAALVESIRDGWSACQRSPAGPAVLGLDVLLQEQPVADPDPALAGLDSAVAGRPAPDPAVVEHAAAALAAAERPAIVTDRPLDAAGAEFVVELAERTGAALVEFGSGISFPVGHPHDCSDRAGDVLARADVVVFVEARDTAWRPPGAQTAGRPTAIVIGLGTAKGRGWMRTESSGSGRIELVADATLALSALVDAVGSTRRGLTPAFAELSGVDAVPADLSGDAPFHPGQVGRELARALDGTPFLVANGWLGGWARRTLGLVPGQVLGRSGGEGLGYGPGAAVGAALAVRDENPGTVVVDLQGDGDLLYTPQALWTAVHHRIPLLVLVEANGSYERDVHHQRNIARARGRPGACVGPGVTLDEPRIDFAALARAQGCEAWEPPADLDALTAVLAKAVSAVTAGAVAVVEVPVREMPR
jgi:thiamine pyrophosphate-dependent acetolactate synthase large subunit-like protein